MTAADDRRPLVLVADDDQDILELVARRLERAGYEVAKAGNGKQALELAAGRPPDVAVLDILMPALDGYAVCQQLQAMSSTPPPVIFLTAQGYGPAQAFGLELGAAAYIVKPFEPAELLAAVRSALAGSASAEPAGEPDGGDGAVAADVPRPLVLVADDDEDILALVALRLERAGFGVVTATDGEEALRLVRQRAPDLAVLDVTMPKLTGSEVTRHVRESEHGARMPVILLTARVQETDVENGLESGADDYVMKPFSPRDLAERVQAILAPG